MQGVWELNNFSLAFSGQKSDICRNLEYKKCSINYGLHFDI
jgi:hypothetical protein